MAFPVRAHVISINRLYRVHTTSIMIMPFCVTKSLDMAETVIFSIALLSCRMFHSLCFTKHSTTY